MKEAERREIERKVSVQLGFIVLLVSIVSLFAMVLMLGNANQDLKERVRELDTAESKVARVCLSADESVRFGMYFGSTYSFECINRTLFVRNASRGSA